MTGVYNAMSKANAFTRKINPLASTMPDPMALADVTEGVTSGSMEGNRKTRLAASDLGLGVPGMKKQQKTTL
jgi:hypothetical protein